MPQKNAAWRFSAGLSSPTWVSPTIRAPIMQRTSRSWLKVLKDDPRAIFTAASKAQQAADWMHAQQPQTEEMAA